MAINCVKAGLVLIAGVLIVLSGCSRLKAAPAVPSGFISTRGLESNPQIPFHQSWWAEGLDWNAYDTIYIAPVDVSYLSEMDWWKGLERSRKSLQEDTQRLALHAHKTLERAFREDPQHFYGVVDRPGERTVILEFALTEVIPSKVLLNTLGYVPFVGSAFRLLRTTKGRSHVAFEARFLDGQTGGVIAKFADREAEKYSPVNVKDVTWYGHAQSIISDWGTQLVEVVNREEGEEIPDYKPYHLKPW